VIGIISRMVTAKESESVPAMPNMLTVPELNMCGNLLSPPPRVHALSSGDVADVPRDGGWRRDTNLALRRSIGQRTNRSKSAANGEAKWTADGTYSGSGIFTRMAEISGPADFDLGEEKASSSDRHSTLPLHRASYFWQKSPLPRTHVLRVLLKQAYFLLEFEPYSW